MSLPIYQQLMNTIKKKIIDGELNVGEKLESERSMSVRYGINRMTVRNAIKKLEEEGIVKSIRGSGTYVQLVPQIESQIELGNQDHNFSLSMQIRDKGMKSSRRVLSLKKRIVEGEFREYFKNDTLMYELIRVAFINDHPYALQKTYIPCSYFENAERFDFENFSLYEYMTDHGHCPCYSSSYLRIEKLPEEYTTIMNVKKDKKFFLYDYQVYDTNHNFIEYTISYHHPQYTKCMYERSIV